MLWVVVWIWAGDKWKADDFFSCLDKLFILVKWTEWRSIVLEGLGIGTYFFFFFFFQRRRLAPGQKRVGFLGEEEERRWLIRFDCMCCMLDCSLWDMMGLVSIREAEEMRGGFENSPVLSVWSGKKGSGMTTELMSYFLLNLARISHRHISSFFFFFFLLFLEHSPLPLWRTALHSAQANIYLFISWPLAPAEKEKKKKKSISLLESGCRDSSGPPSPSNVRNDCLN